jgi:hypoxanthine phosphoribosyltransferase/phosphoribosyl-AMP cyclohydrolase
MSETAKLYFTYDQIHRTVEKLAGQIVASGWEPDLIVAIGTGGFIPARILKTYLGKPIYTVGVALYDDKAQMADSPRKIQWIDEVERKLEGRKVLLVDEVDDSRTTLAYCLGELLAHAPAEIGVAVLHCKDKPKRGVFPPEIKRYWAGEHLPDDWVVYPWDARDIGAHSRAAAASAAADHRTGPDGRTVEESVALMVDFGADGQGLVPVVTQDARTRDVLILSWTNREAFEETRRSGLAAYWSRSRNCLWRKGETSGDRLRLVDIRVNCEQNSLLYLVEPLGGGACHAKKADGHHHESCYYRSLGADGRLELAGR